MIRAIIWKELRDLSRDKKTVVIIVLLPLVTLPLLGFLTFYLNKEQPANIAIVDLDKTPLSQRFVQELESWINAYSQALGQRVVTYKLDDAKAALTNTTIDYVVVIEKGFSSNLSKINEVALVITSKRVETVRAQTADTIVSLSLNSLSKNYAEKRVKQLTELANVDAPPDAILEPVRKQVQVHKGAGVAATQQDEMRFYTVRFLAFALLFVVMPTITYISDSIMGEKERRTFEALLSAPIKEKDILLGKIVASSLLGISASIADVAGVILYFYFLQKAFGTARLTLDPGLVLFHSLDVALTVIVTLTLVIPFVLKAGSVRTANIYSSAVLGIAMVIFFAALFTDFDRLPRMVSIPLMMFPYTHSVLALTGFVAQNQTMAITHITVLVLFSVFFFLASLRMFNREKILMPPSRTE